MSLPRHFIIGILMFCLFIASGLFLFVDFGINSAKINEFNTTFNVVNSITDKTDSIRSSITDADTDFGIFGVLNSLINSAWTGLGILFDVIDLSSAVISDSATFFGLPTGVFIIISLIVAGITVFISFSIWSAIFQRDL